MDDYGGGGGGGIRLVCEHCGDASYYDPEDAEDGFFSCRQCSAIHTSTQATVADPDDFPLTGNLSVRPRTTQPTPTPAPHPTPRPAHPPAAPAFDDFSQPSEPRDFAPGTGAWGEPGELAARVRWRYVRGLQVILQRQLEVLVGRYRVSPLVCGVAGTIWIRWVAASTVFDEMWVRDVLAKTEDADSEERPTIGGNHKPLDINYGWTDDTLAQKDKHRVEFVFLRSLRMLLPVYSTLGVCFLACHVAREAILPTDIYKWAMEGKIPYVAVFTEMDKLLGGLLKDCPLDAKQLFRPVQVIGAWQLESAAGSIAQRIGLHLPSVNFYMIAQRFLKELSLPIERILAHACRIYQWSMPPGLWLSSNPARVPTRVSVMAILIVSLRLLYNINRQGIWEEISEEGRNTADSDVKAPPVLEAGNSDSEEFGARELLRTLVAAYDKIDVVHDYSKDLHSYLKYCKDVVFPGITCSIEEEHLIEIFWDMYKGREDVNAKPHVERMKTTNGANKRSHDGTFVGKRCFSPSSGDDALQRIRLEMEDRGFYYLPPCRRIRSNGYLHYERKMLSGILVYVAHADYYILLRAFAKLAEVDVRIMHTTVLKLEKRLDWIEQQIGKSLDALENLCVEANDQQRPVD